MELLYKDGFVPIYGGLPKRGKHVIGITNTGVEVYCYRCQCDDSKCKVWRDSFTDEEIKWLNVIGWQYVDMARYREIPRCPDCGEIIAKAVYNKPISGGLFFGDTFSHWVYEDHTCNKNKSKNKDSDGKEK